MPRAAIVGGRPEHDKLAKQSKARSSVVAAAGEARSGILFVTPYLIVFSVLLVFPLFSGMWLSLHKADLFGGSQFIGIENYSRLFRDDGVSAGGVGTPAISCC